MTMATAFPERCPTGLILLARILCITFAAEMIVDRLLPGLLPPMGAAAFVLFHVVGLNLISAPLVWFLVVLPIGRLLEDGRPSALLPLFFRLLAFMLTVELVTIRLLPESLAGVGTMVRQAADAFLVALACAPFFWRIMVRFCAAHPLRRSLAELPVPVVLLYKLTLVLFAVEFSVTKVLMWFGPLGHATYDSMIEAALLGLCSVPFLWWLIIRPLRLSALADKAQFDHVISQVVDAVIIIGEQNRIDSLNAAAELIFGFQSQELVGRSVQTIIDLPEGSHLLQDNGAQTITTGVHHELIGIHHDGHRVPLSLSASRANFAGRQVWVLILRDMSEIRAAEMERERSLALVEATLQSTADGILAVDWGRRVQVYNDRFVEMLKIPQTVLEERGHEKMVDYIASLMIDPDTYHARVDALCQLMDLSALDLLHLKDGRVIEQYSQPQQENGVSVGRVWSFRDISARIRSERELRQSVERFRALATNAPVGIIETDASGNCVFVNEQWCAIVGSRPEDAVGKGWDAVLPPANVDWIREEWLRSVQEGRRFSLEISFQTPDGRENSVLGSATTIHNLQGAVTGYLGIIVDINERKQVERALLESEERFRQIFEQSEDAIVLFSPGNCRIIDLNPTAEKLYGYSKEELTGLQFNVFTDDTDYQDFMHAVCQIETDQTRHLDRLLNRRKDGGEIIVSARAKVIKLQSQPAVYCTLRDITDRLRMEEEARAIQSQLIHSNKMSSLGILVAGIAHEINNPNNYIMANAQLLSRIWDDMALLLDEESKVRGDFVLGGLPYSNLKESLPEMIDSINEGARRIRDIINNLKNFARQGSAIKDSSVDVNRIVKASMALLNHHINKFTDHFRLELEAGMPHISGSPQQLEQVIINLVLNALQALPTRKRAVEVQTAFDPSHDALIVTVRDEGCGIPEELIPRIMEPFFTTKLDSGGTGLGLAIADSIVRAHQGVLQVSSIPGVGTTVTITLPVARGQLAAA